MCQDPVVACVTTSTPYGFALVVSSTTRPTTPPDLSMGRVIFEADTLRTLQYDGTGWVCMSEPAQTYTPSVTSGITVGNGTWTARFHRSDGWADASIVFTLGTTSAITGRIVIGLPYTGFNVIAVGGTFNDTGLVEYPTKAASDSNNIYLDAIDASLTYAKYAFTSATIPFTWGSTDVILAWARYQMASRYS